MEKSKPFRFGKTWVYEVYFLLVDLRHNQRLISRFTQKSIHKYRSAGEVVDAPCMSLIYAESGKIFVTKWSCILPYISSMRKDNYIPVNQMWKLMIT